MKQAKSLRDVPARFRNRARCFDPQENTHLARPEEIQLEGSIRRENISTSVGSVQLRWPRSVEVLFGRTPLRAMTDAARTVSRAIRTSGFPTSIQNLSAEWNVVFMDANLPETQIPQHLISNCHPGWMTPPANIYIVAQRVAEGCSNQRVSASVADAQLTEVLVHEMGHAVEYHLLKDNYRHDRMRAEGFATWFEMFASQYSSIMNSSALRREKYMTAAYAIKASPNSFQFSGSGLDYARASMYFAAIEDRKGVRGLMEVYASMVRDNLDFFSAIKKVTYWNKAQLDKEIQRLVQKD